MAMTRTQLRGVIKTGIASRSDVTDAQINTYLDIAQERIARVYNWRELQNTTDLTLTTGAQATDKTVSLSTLTNLRDIKDFVVEDGSQSRKLVQKTTEEFDRLIVLPEFYSANHPLIYTLWGVNEAIIFPTPDSAYTARVRWYNWTQAFTGDGDTSDLLRKDDMIIFMALSFIFALLREEEQANRYFAYYQNELKKAIENEDQPMPDLRITPNFGFADSTYGDYWKTPFNNFTGVGY